MKNLILCLFTLSGLLTQAQITLCDQTYTTGNYYMFEVAIPITGNGLPNMAPLYAVTTTLLDTWEDSCFGGPCTHTVYNEYNEDTITTCITYTLTDSLGYVDTLTCCFSQAWNGQAWVISLDNQVDINESLYEICDSLTVYSTFSSENNVILSTNLDSLFSDIEIAFSWESWDDYLNVDIVEGQNANFDIPNNIESFYFLLQVVLSSEQSESSVLCIYPFLIQWDSTTNSWQANSLTMSQMPTSVDDYSQPSDRKLIKIVDALGRESQENNSMILFYIYDDGKIEKKFILK